MLAVVGVAVTAPMGHAVTFHNLTVTVTVNGQTSTATFRVVDVNSDGTVSLAVGSALLSQINDAFGTTTFAFPGSFTGTFTVNGSTVTVTLSSTDTFILQFTLAPPGGVP
jgi:hypothetical protein